MLLGEDVGELGRFQQLLELSDDRLGVADEACPVSGQQALALLDQGGALGCQVAVRCVT